MLIIPVILIEGSYLYFQKEENYSQENFKLIHFPSSQTYHIQAEILTRMENGEFLKVLVQYEMNNYFYPNFVRIEKSLGNKYAVETYKLDPLARELKYTFQNSNSSQDYSRPFNSTHYLTSPAFSTATIFTLSKKLNVSGRTAVSFLGSDNDWTYEKPPEEKNVYAEFKARDVEDFKINQSKLPANQLCLYEFDSSSKAIEIPVEIFVSKFFGLPYQMIQGDEKIVVKNMRKNS